MEHAVSLFYGRLGATLPDAAKDVLKKVYSNIIDNPSEPKFRRLKRENKALREKLLGQDGIDDALALLGWVKSDEAFELPLLEKDDAESQIKELQTALDALASKRCTRHTDEEEEVAAAMAFSRGVELGRSTSGRVQVPELMRSLSPKSPKAKSSPIMPSAEDLEAAELLEEIFGITQASALEVYYACDKDPEKTLNLLREAGKMPLGKGKGKGKGGGASKEFSITVEKTSDSTLGLRYIKERGKALRIQSIDPQGLIGAWNQRNLNQQVKQEDLLVSVNMVTGDADMMASVLESIKTDEGTVALEFVHPRDVPRAIFDMGPYLLAQGGRRIPTQEALRGKSRIGLYFGGAWCPHCPPFTTGKLKPFYDAYKKLDPGFEIIFLSSDASESEAVRYFNNLQGDWLMMELDRRRVDRLSISVGSEGVPTLSICNAEGYLIHKEARDVVESVPADIAASEGLFQQVRRGMFVEPSYLGLGRRKFLEMLPRGQRAVVVDLDEEANPVIEVDGKQVAVPRGCVRIVDAGSKAIRVKYQSEIIDMEVEDKMTVGRLVKLARHLNRHVKGSEAVLYQGREVSENATLQSIGVLNFDELLLRPSGDVPMERSNFGRHYSRDKAAKTSFQAWEAVREYLKAFLILKGFSSSRASNEADRFQQILEKDITELSKKQITDADLLRKLVQEPGVVVARCWTSQQTFELVNKEWCGLLQEGLRLDADELVPWLVKIFATMSMYSVSGDRKHFATEMAKISWPSIDNEVTLEQKWTLHRGGRLPLEHAKWYEKAAKDGLVYRVRMALPTSKQGQVAIGFMEQYSYPRNEPKAYFRYHLDPVHKCLHVNCLESVTKVEQEQEFCFPPYSAFKGKSLRWDAEKDYYIVDVDVMPDNKSVAEGGLVPNLAPIAPWA